MWSYQEHQQGNMTTKLPQEWRLWDCTETNHLYYIAFDQSTAYRVMYFVRELYQGRLRCNISKLTHFKGPPLRKQNGTKRNNSDLINRICFIVVWLAAILIDPIFAILSWFCDNNNCYTLVVWQINNENSADQIPVGVSWSYFTWFWENNCIFSMLS